MTTLHGCVNTDSKKTNEIENKTSRTVEEAAVEAEFEPLFEFLSQEEKDFSNIRRYSFILTIVKRENSSSEVSEEISFHLTNDNNLLNGKIKIINATTKEEKVFPVKLEDGKLVYLEDIPEDKLLHDVNQFLQFTIEKKEIENLVVSNYIGEHPETDMVDIGYELPMNSKIIKDFNTIKSVQNIEDVSFGITKRGDGEFEFLLSINSPEYMYILVSGFETVS